MIKEILESFSRLRFHIVFLLSSIIFLYISFFSGLPNSTNGWIFPQRDKILISTFLISLFLMFSSLLIYAIQLVILNHRKKRIKVTAVDSGIKQFSNLSDFYKHIIVKMLDAKKIDDLSWAKPEVQEKTKEDQIFYKAYLEAKKSFCEKSGVIYREVFTFPTQERIKRAVDFINLKYYGYNARYHRTYKNDSIPRLSFILIESENIKEVDIFFYSAKQIQSYNEIRLSISIPKIIELFQDYYDNIFNSGISLKDGDYINQKEIKQILNRYKKDKPNDK